MSRHKTYIGSHEVQIETERAITHLLTGCLDEATVRPVPILEKQARKEQLSLEEMTVLDKYNRMTLRGSFERKALDWCESEEQAEQAKAQWPNYVNFRTLPVEVHLP